MEFLQKRKPSVEKKEINQISRPTNYLEARINFKILKEISGRIETLDSKISRLEKILNKPSLQHKFNSSKLNGYSINEENILSKIEELNSRLLEIEKKFEDRIPTKVLSEDNFKKEVQDSDNIVNEIILKMKNLMDTSQRTQLQDGTMTVVESKRIEKIKSLLKRHEKLSSSELSELMGLSRTRCNEYFKMMERLNLVRPSLVGREKFYGLK